MMEESSWRLFDRVADEYDQILPFFSQWGAGIVGALDPPPGCRLLDLGAGRGAVTARALARGCRVTAIDASPSMVRHLTSEYPDADAQVMDAQALDLPDDAFDLVVSTFVIHLLDDPAAGIAEAHRVLVPGGRFALTGYGGRGSHPVEQPSLGSRFDALFAEFTPYLPPGGGIGRPVDAAESLEAAGFVDLRQDHVHITLRVPDGDTLWSWAMSHGYRAFIDDLPADRREEFHARTLTLPADDHIMRRATEIWSGAKPG